MPSGKWKRLPSKKEQVIASIDRQIAIKQQYIEKHTNDIDSLLERRKQVLDMPEPEKKEKIYVSERYQRQAEKLREKWQDPEFRENWNESMAYSRSLGKIPYSRAHKAS